MAEGTVIGGLLIVATVNVVFSSPQCPPGGRYFDKHVGQNGRYACCSEICKSGFFPAECNKKCPNYAKDKTIDLQAGGKADGDSDAKTGNVLDKPSSPPALTHVLLPVAAVTIIVLAVGLGALARVRGCDNVFTLWTRILPRGQENRQQQEGAAAAATTNLLERHANQDPGSQPERAQPGGEASQHLLGHQQGQGQGQEDAGVGDESSGRLQTEGGSVGSLASGVPPAGPAYGGGLLVGVAEGAAAPNDRVCRVFQTAREERKHSNHPIQVVGR